MISKIHIENIRGFQNATLNINLLPNIANILVAPNGFGKSSISTAFACAKGRKLQVEEKDKYENNILTPAILAIEHNNIKLEANSESNEITDVFEIHVIKSNIEPKAKLPKINGFTIAKPYLQIPDIDLGPKYDKENIDFKIQKYKDIFNNNPKVVPNFSNHCADEILRVELLNAFPSIEKLSQSKSLSFFTKLTNTVNNLSGTKRSLSDDVETKYSLEINIIPPLKNIFDILSKHNNHNTWLEKLIICYILMDMCACNKNNLKKWLQYAAYSRRIQSSRNFIEDINGAWVSAEIKEVKGRIVVNFPDASSLSNGQRDLLYFGCSLLRTRETASVKPCILLIDEIFDYLDDANIVVAQYFLSKLIESYRKDNREIFVCILTHLDPLYFKAYALKRQRTIYLDDKSQKVTETMRKLILHREDSVWAADLSRYFLHYHPEDKNISEVFNSQYGLKKKHGQSHGFYEFLKAEWDKCVGGSEAYDPFAVCAHIRVGIEKCAYIKIRSQPDQEIFLTNCNGTVKKLEFAESLGISVPEACFLVGVVYNEALHLKNEIGQSSAIALRLRNLGLQKIMAQSINW